jgi:hypothetical protein
MSTSPRQEDEDKFGFLHAEIYKLAPPVQDKLVEKREKRDDTRKMKWAKMFASWDEYTTTKYSKLLSRIHKGSKVLDFIGFLQPLSFQVHCTFFFFFFFLGDN